LQWASTHHAPLSDPSMRSTIRGSVCLRACLAPGVAERITFSRTERRRYSQVEGPDLPPARDALEFTQVTEVFACVHFERGDDDRIQRVIADRTKQACQFPEPT
jgi:hypothetical protein